MQLDTCLAVGQLFCLTPNPWSTFNSPPVVDLGYSKYEGVALGCGVKQFLGMRYASPPNGDLRFRAPISPAVTVGTQRAHSFMPICLGTGTQYPSPREDEDCLFINVWSPADATEDSKLPVWFYIQGGGYSSNANANYNGSEVVVVSGQNIVFVNFNYRVGSWGFLASEKVRADGNLNVGLLDQRFAMEWMQKHIAKFGGDPDHVVIHGASAGAGSVMFHLAAHGGRYDGLFAGAILQSPFLPTHPLVDELEWQFDNFARAVGCDASSDQMTCLRSKDTATLQAANAISPCPGRQERPRFYWTPTIDRALIHDYPYRMFEEGRFIQVPVMIGDDTDEGSYFAVDASSPSDICEFFKDNYPFVTDEDCNDINDHYPIMDPLPHHAPYFPSASAAYGDSTFTCPGSFLASAISSQFSPVYNYRYNVLDYTLLSLGLGVPHTFESPAIFGVGNAGDDPHSSYSTYNKEVVPMVMNYWISFVRALDPNVFRHKQAPEWSAWVDGNAKRLRIQTADTMMEHIPREHVEIFEFWRKLGDTMRH